MLNQLLIAIEQITDQLGVGLNTRRKDDELVVLAHCLEEVEHVGAEAKIDVVHFLITDLRSTAGMAQT